MKLPKDVLKHPINKSDKFKVMVSVWDFGASHPQTERRLYGKHPCGAKFRPKLIDAILRLYGEEPILDPMCGSGTTNLAATLLGMENYGLDYEQEYVDILRKNLENLPASLNTRLGKTVIEQGDARQLSFPDDFFGLIAFSPPYWKAIQGNRKSWGMYDSSKIRRRNKYSDDPNNIGNIKSYRRYLSEMLKVYKECFMVLKPGRLMVVVTKDINRNYLTVPIGADTIKTVQRAGFKVFDIAINKMYFPSFWMVHYYVKQQENGIMRALTTHEYVLVFKKT